MDLTKFDPDKVIKVCAGVVVLLVFLLNVVAINFHPIPKGNEDAATRTSGMIETVVVFVIGYYFGSSLGSSKRADQINRLMDTAMPTGGTVTSTTNTETKVVKKPDDETT